MTVIVIDINENRPEFSQPVYVMNISESTEVGAEVISVTAADVDHDSKLVYSIHCVGSYTTQNMFRIDHHNGSVIVTQPLDRSVIQVD